MYQVLLLAPDGDYQTEKPRFIEEREATIEDACECSSDMGSRWIFYPVHFIIKDNGQLNLNQRIIETPDCIEFEHLKGLSIKTVIKHFKENEEDICNLLNAY